MALPALGGLLDDRLNENTWAAATNSADLLAHLNYEVAYEPWPPSTRPLSSVPRGRPAVTARQLRLATCACCRAVWGRLRDDERGDVVRAEGYADADAAGQRARYVDLAERFQLRTEQPILMIDSIAPAEGGVGGFRRPEARLAWAALHPDASAGFSHLQMAWDALELPTGVPAFVLRDLVGDPYRDVCYEVPAAAAPPGRELVVWADGTVALRYAVAARRAAPVVIFQHAWLTPTVLDVAAAAYDDRDWAALPVLADALEDAGCDYAALLAHLRGSGPHARGCWALETVLSSPHGPRPRPSPEGVRR